MKKCPDCGNSPLSEVDNGCKKCIAYVREYKRQWYLRNRKRIAAHRKRLRDKVKDDGLCTRCEYNPVPKGYVNCDECRARARRDYKRLNGKGRIFEAHPICKKCGYSHSTVYQQKRDCETCKKYWRKVVMERRKKKEERDWSLCAICWKNHPGPTSNVFCEPCNLKEQERIQLKHENKTAWQKDGKTYSHHLRSKGRKDEEDNRDSEDFEELEPYWETTFQEGSEGVGRELETSAPF